MGTLLIISNPLPKELKKVWDKARRINPKLTKEEFAKAATLFHAHYKRMPNLSDVTKKKVTSESAILVYVGDIKSLDYETKNSVKDKYTWRHKTETPMYVSHTGKKVYVSGKMRMKKDGFLHD